MILATTIYDWGRASAVFGLDEPGHTIVPTQYGYDFTINDADAVALLIDTISALYGPRGPRN